MKIKAFIIVALLLICSTQSWSKPVKMEVVGQATLSETAIIAKRTPEDISVIYLVMILSQS